MLDNLWKNTQLMTVGIDIGSHAIKAILLSQGAQGYVLEDYAIEMMPRHALIDREIQDIEVVGNVINRIRQQLSVKATEAVAAVSGQTVITKVISMDASLTEAEIASQINIEADSLIPYPLDEVSLDFETLGSDDSVPNQVNVLLSAARTESVQARVAALALGGFHARIIDVESHVLGRAYQVCWSLLPMDAKNKRVVLIDIGAQLTLFSAIDSGKKIYSREQMFGGEQYTRAIMAYYHQSYEEAEQAKIADQLPSSNGLTVLAPFYRLLQQKIRQGIQTFLTASGQKQVDHLLISGGTAALPGVEILLTEALGIDTVIANPFTNMTLSSAIDKDNLFSVAPQFMVATGLALRNFTPWHI